MKRVVVIVVLILITAGAFGQSTSGTGQWLHDLWVIYHMQDKNTISDFASAFQYQGYVLGAATVMEDVGWLALAQATYGQWFAVVGKYLDDHPEEWNLAAEIVVFRALYAVWPGKKKPS